MDFSDSEPEYDSDQAADLSGQGFVEEISYEDVEFLEVVGRGAFGTVQKAKWQGHLVAVKTIEAEAEAKAFRDEVQQLSSVQHPNIIRLYGTCSRKPKVCLIMEYAEGGSLYNILHPHDPDATPPPYTVGHVISWALQCAKAVAYLHGMKPKPIVHRDLKPPNMLLTKSGTVLKICDFGTACYMHTNMTSNKGSAAWMAPEVFEGIKYGEKCDVYSFGIVLWEMITRKRPFEDVGPLAFRVMWAAYSGKRPSLVRNIPKALQNLIQRCWVKDQKKRPSFTTIVAFFEKFSEFVSGGDVHLETEQRNQRSADTSVMSFGSYERESQNKSSLVDLRDDDSSYCGYNSDDKYSSVRTRRETVKTAPLEENNLHCHLQQREESVPLSPSELKGDSLSGKEGIFVSVSPLPPNNDLDSPDPLDLVVSTFQHIIEPNIPLEKPDIDDDPSFVEDHEECTSPANESITNIIEDVSGVSVPEPPCGRPFPTDVDEVPLEKLKLRSTGDTPPSEIYKIIHPPKGQLLTVVDNRHVMGEVVEGLNEPCPSVPSPGIVINNLSESPMGCVNERENYLDDHISSPSSFQAVVKSKALTSPQRGALESQFIRWDQHCAPGSHSKVSPGEPLVRKLDTQQSSDESLRKALPVLSPVSQELNPLDKDTDTDIRHLQFQLMQATDLSKMPQRHDQLPAVSAKALVGISPHPLVSQQSVPFFPTPETPSLPSSSAVQESATKMPCMPYDAHHLGSMEAVNESELLKIIQDKRSTGMERVNAIMTPPPVRCVSSVGHGTTSMSMGHFGGSSTGNTTSYLSTLPSRMTPFAQRPTSQDVNNTRFIGLTQTNLPKPTREYIRPPYDCNLNISPPETDPSTDTFVNPIRYSGNHGNFHRVFSPVYEQTHGMPRYPPGPPLYPINAWGKEHLAGISGIAGPSIKEEPFHLHLNQHNLNNLGEDPNKDDGYGGTRSSSVTRSTFGSQSNLLDGEVCWSTSNNIDNRLVDMYSRPNSDPLIPDFRQTALPLGGLAQRQYSCPRTAPVQQRPMENVPYPQYMKRSKSDSSKSAIWQVIDPDIMPVKPNPFNQESVNLFESHSRLVDEYVGLQEELDYLLQRKSDLKNQRSEEEKEQSKNFKYLEEYISLTEEKESLMELYNYVKCELDKARQERYNLGCC